MTQETSRIEFRLSVIEIWQISVFLFSVIGGGTYWFTTTISNTVHNLELKQIEMSAQAADDRRDTKDEIAGLRQQILEYLYKQTKQGG